jgi:hypothetical protein
MPIVDCVIDERSQDTKWTHGIDETQLPGCLGSAYVWCQREHGLDSLQRGVPFAQVAVRQGQVRQDVGAAPLIRVMVLHQRQRSFMRMSTHVTVARVYWRRLGSLISGSSLVLWK